MAATQGGGLFVSTDCGVTFESAGNLGVGRNLYDIAFDPTAPNRIAVAGWGVGVAVSEDLGKTWQLRNAGLPSNVRVERRVRPRQARPPLCQRARRGALRLAGLRHARGPGTGWKAAGCFA